MLSILKGSAGITCFLKVSVSMDRSDIIQDPLDHGPVRDAPFSTGCNKTRIGGDTRIGVHFQDKRAFQFIHPEIHPGISPQSEQDPALQTDPVHL